MKKVSVIVPVYKVEPYLNRCIESIVCQTYMNLEIILVDDGSPDECPAMCDAWAEKDARIIVLHKKNGGLSDARNAGLNIATGEYISFVDSDDTVKPDYIEILYRRLTEENADISVVNYVKVDENGTEYPQAPNETISDRVYTGKEILRQSFKISNPGTAFVVICAKLYKREVFSEYRFERGRLNEDEFAFFPIYLKAEKVACVAKNEYLYLQRAGSIMNQGISDKRIRDNYDCWQKRMELAKNDEILEKRAVIGFCVWIFLTAFPHISKSHELYKTMVAVYRKYIRTFIFDKDIELPVMHKVVYFISQLSPYYFARFKSKVSGG